MTCQTCKYAMPGVTEKTVFCGLFGGLKQLAFVCQKYVGKQ